MAAEAAFDVPSNPAASTTQDMGMDKGWRSLGEGGLLFLLQLHYCCRLVLASVIIRQPKWWDSTQLCVILYFHTLISSCDRHGFILSCFFVGFGTTFGRSI